MDIRKRFFTNSLLEWNAAVNDRPMPWKGEKDPYKIWLSEIILQQTRVEQGWHYYNRFVENYPTVQQLAAAPEKNVFKLWEGLGYYSRCKNLIATAHLIVQQYGGNFPSDYENILALKGVGPYTAAAIASFAFDLPYAVVDGNVFRVLARYFDIPIAIDSTEGKKIFSGLANELLDKKQPAIYNQSLMDFGAVVCKPKQPLCTQCPLQKRCGAYANGLVHLLPVKEKKIQQKTRWFFYFLINYNGKLFVRKRSNGDIWENLYEFVLLETAGETDLEQLKKTPAFTNVLGNLSLKNAVVSGIYSQKLTHQTIHGRFVRLELKKKQAIKGYELVTDEEMAGLPFPKLITTYLKDKNVSLNLL